jgi:hypothetical protein
MADIGPEASGTRAMYLPTTSREEIGFQAVIITDEKEAETMVGAGRIPNTDTTLLFSLPFVPSGNRQLLVRVGTFPGIVPDKSDPNWRAFEQSARRIAKSGQAVLVEKFSERVAQIVLDEQQYARQMSHRQSP